MQNKLILFDFDGTIADSLPLVKDIINHLAKKHSFKQMSDSDIEILRNKGPKEIKEIVGISWWRLPFIGRDFKKEANKIIKDIPVVPGIKNVLQTLKEKNCIVGILTSNSKKNVEEFLVHHKIEHYIDLIIGDVGMFGKAKKIEKTIKNQKVNKTDVYYIGDEIRDISAARSVGIKIISVSWGFNSAEKLKSLEPDFFVKKPNEIISALML